MAVLGFFGGLIMNIAEFTDNLILMRKTNV